MSLAVRFRLYAGRVGMGAFGLAVALDMFANALAGGNPKETLSSRGMKAWERWQQSHDPHYLWGCILCRTLGLIWKQHCPKTVQRDQGK